MYFVSCRDILVHEEDHGKTVDQSVGLHAATFKASHIQMSWCIFLYEL